MERMAATTKKGNRMIKKFFHLNYEIRVAILYWSFGFIWIFLTDYLLEKLFTDPVLLTRIQNYKGWFFVTASALLIYFLFRHYFSEQRHIQRSLIESEEKFRAVFESANVGKSHTKLSGELSVNKALADMLGYTREELAQLTWQSLTPQEEIETIQTNLDELLSSGKDSTRLTKRYIHKNGSILWADVSVALRRDANGNPMNFITTIVDITAQKQAEEALRKSEERLRLAVESAQQGIYDLNIQTGKVIVNDIYAKMFGHNPETFSETIDTWLERLHQDDFEITRKYFQEYINGLTDNYKIEFRMKTASGDYIWILSIGKIVEYDSDEKPLRMLGTHTNISETKQLGLEKDLFNNLFDSSLNEIYLFDAQTFQFRQVNKAAKQNLGYSQLELLKMTPMDIKPFINQKDFELLVTPLRTNEKDQIIFETSHQRKNGSLYPVEVHLQLLYQLNQPVFAAIILDISERKRTEEILLSERERLEGIIAGTNVGTWGWYVQTGEIIINERWAEIIGYTLEEILPISIDTWFKYSHPDDLKASDVLIQRHFNHELEYYEIEIRMKHKDGHWVWVLDRGKVTSWSADGKPLLMQGTHQDITQRKNNEAKINEQLEELQRWHAITLGREARILELKKEINAILMKAGFPPKYTSINEQLDE